MKPDVVEALNTIMPHANTPMHAWTRIASGRPPIEKGFERVSW